MTKKLTINIPDKEYDRVVDGFTSQCKYQDKMPDGTPNLVTREQFVINSLKKVVLDVVKEWEENQAIEAARGLANQKVDDEIELT